MKALLYLLSSLLLLAASLTMSFLPRIAPTVWAFVVEGALLSALIAVAWTALSATAGTWPRLRTGPLLVVAGLLSLGLGLSDGWVLEMAWGAVGLLVGIPLWLAARRNKARTGAQTPSGVQPPLGHRDREQRA